MTSLTRVKGSAWDTSDNLVIDTLAELNGVSREGILFVSGGLAPNDGMGGWFRYDPLRLRSDHDGHNVIDPTGTTAGRGCWVRQQYDTSPPGKNVSEVQQAVTGQTVFNLQHIRYAPGAGSLAVYVNGTRLTPWSFNEIDSATVEIAFPLRNNDVVEFLYNEQPTGGGTLNVDAGQVNYDNTGSGLMSQTVQGAIDELDATLQAGGGGGGAVGTINASRVPYLPLSPDTSSNVQAAMHWLQKLATDHLNDLNNAHLAGSIGYDPTLSGIGENNVQDALDAIHAKIGSGQAIDIGFENSQTPGLRNNVQTALTDLYNRNEVSVNNLTDHINDPSAAHNISAIFVNSTDPRFHGASDGLLALEKLSADLDTHGHAADEVSFDGSVALLGDDVQEALETLDSNFNDHRTRTRHAHDASAIDYVPATGMTSDTVQAAIDENLAKLNSHVTELHAAHDSKAIRFMPQVRPMMLQADNVEDAIIEAAAGKQIFRGGVDVTLQYTNQTVGMTNNDYYTVDKDGIPHPSWVFANFPAGGTMSGGDKLMWDGTILWHVPGGVRTGAIVGNPPTGVTQVIDLSGLSDSLIIGANAGHLVPALQIVNGDIEADGTVSDGLGTLRQAAAAVPFDPSNIPELQRTSVQTAMEEITILHRNHLLGTGTQNKHKANAILFDTVPDINGSNVQVAIESVQHNIEQHLNSLVAHQAVTIGFDGRNKIPAANLQAGVEVTWNKIDDHVKQVVAAHHASTIQYDPSNSGIQAINLQDALDEIHALGSLGTVDGGTF